MNPRVIENLIILFGLLPCMLFTWWWFVRLVNRQVGLTGEKFKQVMDRIHAHPNSATAYRIGVLYCTCQLVIAAFSRLV